MYKRRRTNRFGSLTEPRTRIEHEDLPGTGTSKFNKKIYKLLPQHAEKVEHEVQNVMKEMQLKALHNNVPPLRTGGILLTDNTLSSYEKHYDSLFFFFADIQEYESLIMLRRKALEYFPAMNPSSIILHHK
jgi:hypothetical protein